jgi:hypothetical protein
MMKAAGRGVAGGFRPFRWQAILVAGQVALAMLLLGPSRRSTGCHRIRSGFAPKA